MGEEDQISSQDVRFAVWNENSKIHTTPVDFSAHAVI